MERQDLGIKPGDAPKQVILVGLRTVVKITAKCCLIALNVI